MTTVPDDRLHQMAASWRELQALQARQKLTQAELLRGCVHQLRQDVITYRARGNETIARRREIIAENKENRERALLYLDWLATQLEKDAGKEMLSGNLTGSDEGEV
jgi:hypothetical protein